MAEEEVKMEPVELTPVAGAEPPKKPNLMGKPTITAALKPGLRLPPKPGATATALKPGLKLPPKPGATVSALKPGLKLPPKPGSTVSALKPGLKLPPKPGATVSALRPGVKLPTRPVIHKPGEATAATALPKPVASTVPSAVVKPVAVDAQGIGKLPTVEAQAIAREDAKVPEMTANPNALEQLKSVTQKLKGITQEIPAQAIMHKTGIISDGASDAQKEAAKHKTARISLSDAMGVAPVKEENAPMKTIRIKRPVDITGATRPVAPIAKPAAPTAAAAPTPEPEPSATQAETKVAEPASTITQRKTLKITRPGGMIRPGTAIRPGATKFGAKRSEATAAAKPTEAAPKDGEVADIPELPSVPAPLLPTAATRVDEGPAWLWTLSAVVQLAACAVVGAVAYFLYENTQTMYF